MSVHLCLSMRFLHSVGVSACHAQGLGWARQGDNGDQGRHNSSSQSQFLQGWRIRLKKMDKYIHRLWLMMWRDPRKGQEGGEVASWICKERWRAKEGHGWAREISAKALRQRAWRDH